MNATSAGMPTLIVVRGWNERTNPAGYALVDELRRAGVDAVDVYVDPAGSTDLAGWAAATIAEIDAVRASGAALHLLAYCMGGNVTLEAVRQLELRDDPPDYVAFVDVRRDHAAVRLTRGLDALYATPWTARLRQQVTRVVPPDAEPVGTVVASVVRRAVRSVRELPQRGWRSHRRRNQALFDAFRLSYSWGYTIMQTPAHCYNTEDSIRRFGSGDPSLNIGQYFGGGFCIRPIDGTHETCIDAEHSAAVIELIEADRRRVVARRGGAR